MDAGTGFVHIAPGHGADDFVLGKANGVEVPETVGPDGAYYRHVPLFAGKRVYTDRGMERSEEHTSELQSLMRISYAVFCLKKKTHHHIDIRHHTIQQEPNSRPR